MQMTFSDILESNLQNVVHTLYTSSLLLICYCYWSFARCFLSSLL